MFLDQWVGPTLNKKPISFLTWSLSQILIRVKSKFSTYYSEA